jgi:hypothetical protein
VTEMEQTIKEMDIDENGEVSLEVSLSFPILPSPLSLHLDTRRGPSLAVSLRVDIHLRAKPQLSIVMSHQTDPKS